MAGIDETMRALIDVINYEGKLRVASLNRRHLLEEDAQLQIFGEIGETGRFPISLQLKSDHKMVRRLPSKPKLLALVEYTA
ncbi:hypothetical protein Tcan_02300 [Toxocara canis]|uniref:Uncharacterized protein n=1 Tax=Toxocara canis TaxID=6265 RepID=A0A0B2UQ89_TOXCA|nr:hypothetical protein Tcan_02300 [Toxocara canis]